MISAKIVADSISTQGVRITTMELNYHRFIHSEFMTHRVFSRNASSSRAIPVEKQIHQVLNTPAMPVHWGRNQSGMQARGEIECPTLAQDVWKYASELSVDRAYELKDLDTHKQVVNRLLEPFQWIKVIVTATEWDNFFKLRLDSGAQPEIRELASHMKEAMNKSIPVELEAGEWHLPYITNEQYTHMMVNEYSITDIIKCSVARCARVAMLNHDGSNPDITKDLLLYDRLVGSTPEHASPTEHQACPMPENVNFNTQGISHLDKFGNYWSGNFRGFLQYRKILEDTNWGRL